MMDCLDSKQPSDELIPVFIPFVASEYSETVLKPNCYSFFFIKIFVFFDNLRILFEMLGKFLQLFIFCASCICLGGIINNVSRFIIAIFSTIKGLNKFSLILFQQFFGCRKNMSARYILRCAALNYFFLKICTKINFIEIKSIDI